MRFLLTNISSFADMLRRSAPFPVSPLPGFSFISIAHFRLGCKTFEAISGGRAGGFFGVLPVSKDFQLIKIR
jgi:hypothetical protein